MKFNVGDVIKPRLSARFKEEHLGARYKIVEFDQRIDCYRIQVLICPWWSHAIGQIVNIQSEWFKDVELDKPPVPIEDLI